MIERADEPLAPRTTLEVGGPARRLVEVEDEAQLAEWLAGLGEPFHVLGGGSNVVVGDGGVDEPVLCLRLRGVERRREGDHVLVTAAAGELWDDLVADVVDAGLAGVECLAGIPGHAGAAPIQNIGAYGQQLGDSLLSVRAYDLQAGATVLLPAARCELGYRNSLFKRAGRQRYLVLGLTLRLHLGAPEPPRYAQLARALDEAGARDLSAVREVVLALRRDKSMVHEPHSKDPNRRSAGSFFVNPLVDVARADTIEREAREAGLLASDETLPRFEADGGMVKLAAAWLIEHAGYRRGHVQGRVGLSSAHALAVINRGGATAAELLGLAQAIREAVKARFAVELHPEPDLLGEFHGAEIVPLRPPLTGC